LAGVNEGLTLNEPRRSNSVLPRLSKSWDSILRWQPQSIVVDQHRSSADKISAIVGNQKVVSGGGIRGLGR
jgi:hypothetical protein